MSDEHVFQVPRVSLQKKETKSLFRGGFLPPAHVSLPLLSVHLTEARGSARWRMFRSERLNVNVKKRSDDLSRLSTRLKASNSSCQVRLGLILRQRSRTDGLTGEKISREREDPCSRSAVNLTSDKTITDFNVKVEVKQSQRLSPQTEFWKGKAFCGANPRLLLPSL